MNMLLVNNRIAVKLDEPVSVTDGGIVLPDDAKEKSCEGVVVAIGPGKFSESAYRCIPMSVAVGNRVIVEKYGQNKVTVDGEELVVMDDSEVLAILPNENGKKK